MSNCELTRRRWRWRRHSCIVINKSLKWEVGLILRLCRRGGTAGRERSGGETETERMVAALKQLKTDLSLAHNTAVNKLTARLRCVLATLVTGNSPRWRIQLYGRDNTGVVTNSPVHRRIPLLHLLLQAFWSTDRGGHVGFNQAPRVLSSCLSPAHIQHLLNGPLSGLWARSACCDCCATLLLRGEFCQHVSDASSRHSFWGILLAGEYGLDNAGVLRRGLL